MITDAQITQARADLAKSGAAVLQGFVAPETIAAMLAEVEPHLSRAFNKEKTHNVYLLRDDETYPPDHARNRKVKTTSATLAYDLIPDGTLRAFYLSDELRAGIAKILGHNELHPYADPLAGLNVLTYAPGCQTGWHFDNANFVVTLMLRPAEAGGDYHYIPFSRSEADDGYGLVERALDGDETGILSLHQSAGDLVIFQGKHTLHRVTPVEGDQDRVIAVLSYDPMPGKILHEDTRRTFYGRAA
jgi:hypothetical protein